MSDIDPAVLDRAGEVVGTRWPGSGVTGLRLLPGHSGLTARAELSGAGAPPVVVLKMCPPGRQPEGRHDVLRQATLIQELSRVSDVPVPATLAIDRRDPPAVIQEWVDGEAAEPVLDMEPGTVEGPVIAGRFRAAAEVLARLHALDPAALVTTAGVAATSPGEEVERWLPTMRSVDPELARGAGELYEELMRDVPSILTPRIVHGDYRLGNVMCSGVAVAAVVDWEIWSVGDPRVDLAWFRIMTAPQDLPGMSTPQPGVPTAEGLLADYEAEAGGSVGEMAWFDAAIRYKMAAIMGNNLKRHRTGARHDPYQERLVETIPTLIRRGLEILS